MKRRSLLLRMGLSVLISPTTSSSAAYVQTGPLVREPLTQRNKGLVRRWIEEGFNKRRLLVIDELFAERFAVNGQVIGREGVKQSMTRHFNGFPDLHVTIDEILAEGGKVGIWYTVEGTHRGEFEGILATGKRVKWFGFDLLNIDGGRISEGRFISDFFGLLTQLGATVSPP